MGIDGGARLGRAFFQARRDRRVIRANVGGVGAAHRIAARGSRTVVLGLG